MPSLRTYPKDLPAALVDGLGFKPLPNARERARDQGEMRMRPKYRSTPDLFAASWVYQTQEQFDAFDEWYETTLLVGSLDFDILLPDRGSRLGHRWYTAQIVGDYQAEVIVGPRYRVRATLRLIYDLGTVRIPPGIESTIRLDFGLTARTLPPPLAATIGLNFGLQALMPTGTTGAVINLNFGLAWVAGSTPPGASERETDSGDEREIDSGDSRITD